MKKVKESPCITDYILFEIETPDSNGFFAIDPISIDKITICFIERDRGATNDKVYEAKYYDPSLQQKYEKTLLEAHKDPTEEKIKDVIDLRKQVKYSAITTTQQYHEAVPVLTLGSKIDPIWTKDHESSLLTKMDTGRFSFKWQTSSMREGDYVIYWNYKIDDQFLTAHQTFTLNTKRQKDTSVLYRYTPEDKYEKLIKRYTPSMYSYKLTTTDLTPMVMESLNKAVAKGFTMLEDMANQLIDVYDANRAHEAILPLLANMLNLQLKSSDVIKWRRQIRQAIPIFKRKGTFTSLKIALDQAGIKLNKITRLWQVTSQYYWTDGFVITNDNETKFIAEDPVGTILGNLSHFSPDYTELEVSLRTSETEVSIPIDYIHIIKPIDASDKPTVIWAGEDVHLFSGDVVKITYRLRDVPEHREGIERYIRTLPLADDRDTKQVYPLRNWNVKLIEEDDPFFDVVIPTRHPSYDPVIYGKTRTDFLYSEKAYNMDAYDGSLRNSYVPCDIDKDFIDICSYCQSSQFNVDIEVEELSNDRILEAKEIINEYTPFHAILRDINVHGVIRDFIPPFTENIESYATNKSDLKESINLSEKITFEIEWVDGKKDTNNV
jgi:P2-related tail formation protein